MLEFGILISTNIKYIDKYLPKLLNQLLKQGFNTDDILVVSGNNNNFSEETFMGVQLYKVNYTGFHLTSLIFLIENNISTKKAWFAIHDTCELQSNGNFYHKICDIYENNFKKNNLNTLRLQAGKSKDIGFYSYNYLLTIKKYILRFRIFRFDTRSLQRLKQYLILIEDKFLDYGNKNKDYINKTKVIKEFYNDLDSNGKILRLKKNYYNDIGFIKIQRCFNRSSINVD